MSVIVSEEVEKQVARAKAILEGKEKGLPEEAKRLYSLACSSAEEEVKKDRKKGEPLFVLSRTLFERAQSAKLYKLEEPQVYEKLISRSLRKVEKLIAIDQWNDEAYLLWAKILLHKAEYVTSLRENELLMTLAAEKLLKATKVEQPQKKTYEMLEKAVEGLNIGTKERQRSGKAVYHIAGQYTKQGGGKKSSSWKSRWFVVTDTAIHYYKDKKDWETGPVQGQPAQPQGTIEFTDVTDVVTHTDFVCTVDRRPKGTEKTFCLHVVTADRTYNIVGFETIPEVQKWVSAVKFAVQVYNTSKAAKKWLRDTSITTLKGYGTDIYDGAAAKKKEAELKKKKSQKKEE